MKFEDPVRITVQGRTAFIHNDKGIYLGCWTPGTGLYLIEACATLPATVSRAIALDAAVAVVDHIREREHEKNKLKQPLKGEHS